MRKIESQMLEAIQDQAEFKKGNTCVELMPLADQVSIMDCDLVARVYLHGNLIAQFNRALNELTVWDGGWQSATTKSRLNALLSEFAPSYGIVQHKHCWYITDKSQDDWRHWGSYATFRAGSLKDFG